LFRRQPYEIYVVYDQRSGKIIHTHSQLQKFGQRPEDILRFVQPSVERSQLRTLEIEAAGMLADKAYRVNPETKKLEAAELSATSSSGISQFRGIAYLLN
jgi:hypothetical protein